MATVKGVLLNLVGFTATAVCLSYIDSEDKFPKEVSQNFGYRFLLVLFRLLWRL